MTQDRIASGPGGVEWRASEGAIDYPRAVAQMENRVAAIRAGAAPELVWLLEHPPLYTAGTSARPEDLLDPARLPVYRSGRGGRYTYHGPGQRIAYVMLDLARRGRDVGCHVHRLEEWMIRALARLGVEGLRRAGRVGVWIVRTDGREEKIAAIGVRVRHWVSYHGVALNIDPDLDQYRGIIPCGIAPGISEHEISEHEISEHGISEHGISGHGVTSLAALGVKATMADVDAALLASFPKIFANPPICP